MQDRKYKNQEIAVLELKNLVTSLSNNYFHDLTYALDILDATLDEKISIVGSLNSVVENINKFVNKKSFQFEPQTFLAKIDKCLFEDNFDSVTINSKDYQKLFIENSDKIRKRYEPVTSQSVLANGIFGYLQGPNGEAPKPIKVSKSIESGKINISKDI